MEETLCFACQCGAVRGTVAIPSPIDGECLVCHCHDCRDFIRLMGKADTMLDDLGGLALFNFRGSRLRLEQGTEKLASLHMTDRPVLRWYASCCDTPMFNSFATSNLPFLDILVPTIRDATALSGLRKRQRHLFTKSATGDASGLRKTYPLAMMARTFPRMVREWAGGARKANPLFDPSTGKPVAEPRRVSAKERAAIT